MLLKKIKEKYRLFSGKDININRLKKEGLIVGKNFKYGSYCFIDPSHCFLIKIGDNVTFSSNVHILAHDASTKKLLGYSIIAKTTISSNAFLGAYTIVLPGVTIGKNSIIGAGSVVTKNVPKNEIWAGNPAHFISTIEDFKEKYKTCKKEAIFSKDYKINAKLTKEMKKEMINAIGDTFGLIE